ncbi:MAG: hypothetical protein AB8B56_18645 [Crocinitomicaceae bacterium]
MEINKRNRTELKHFFKVNDKPTQEEFADFIDASINQAEDGLVKVEGDPLAIQAEGESVGSLGVIDIFNSFSDENPEWAINLNPRTDPELISSNQPGFNIKDVLGLSRFFIKAGNGNIGVGTIEPTSKLTVVGKGTNSLISAIDTTNEHATVFEVAQEDGKGILSLRNNENNTITQLSGAIETPNFFLGKMGVGTNSPATNLHISEKNAQLRITNTDQTNGASAKLSIENEGSSQRWEIGVQKGQNDLTFGTTNGGTPRIRMKNGGLLESGNLRVLGTAQVSLLTVSSFAQISTLRVTGGLTFGMSSGGHINQDGAFYRNGNNAQLVVKDNFFIRDVSSTSAKFRFNTKDARIGIGGVNPLAPLSISGTGKETHPDNAMHITNSCILFGGANQGKQADSAQISAGKHKPNSLNIVGMGEQSDRKIDLWAEGGMIVRGQIKIPESIVVAFSVSLSVNMTGAKTAVTFGQTNYNIGGHFKNNNHFRAPVKGMYLFTMTMRNNTSDDVGWRLRLNDSDYVNGGASGSSERHERAQLIATAQLHMNSRTVLTRLNANDKVHIEQFGSGGNDNYSSGFEGMLLQAIM